MMRREQLTGINGRLDRSIQTMSWPNSGRFLIAMLRAIMANTAVSAAGFLHGLAELHASLSIEIFSL
jgi:hypothetical protein